MQKFTQGVKDKWLEALNSGKYTQGFGDLVIIRGDEKQHCCIGVLGDICDFLDNNCDADEDDRRNPYSFLRNSIGCEKMSDLYMENDSGELDDNHPRDYSNVIPLIEKLTVQN